MKLLFLGFELFTYWDILIQYINPLPIFLWAFIGGIIGIIGAALLVLLLRKLVFVKRCHWSLKWLSYSYIFIIPLFVGFSVAQWAALHNIERQVIKKIPKYLGDSHILYETYLKEEVEKIVSDEILQLTGNEILETTVQIAQSTAGAALITDTTNNVQKASFSDKMSAFVVQSFLESHYVRNLIVTEVRNQVGKALLMDEKLTKDFFDLKIKQMLDSGIIHTILEKHVKHLIGGLQSKVLLILLVGLLIPCIEIWIANHLYKKKLKNQPPPIPINYRA